MISRDELTAGLKAEGINDRDAIFITSNWDKIAKACARVNDSEGIIGYAIGAFDAGMFSPPDVEDVTPLAHGIV
jgi:hypothetical protein